MTPLSMPKCAFDFHGEAFYRFWQVPAHSSADTARLIFGVALHILALLAFAAMMAIFPESPVVRSGRSLSGLMFGFLKTKCLKPARKSWKVEIP